MAAPSFQPTRVNKSPTGSPLFIHLSTCVTEPELQTRRRVEAKGPVTLFTHHKTRLVDGFKVAP
ncbi:hypothetical protein EYF80_046526 [Liparis tanakae]|uniref:Uncharacterized protein n=1 Tax=Liparis tanakae TaxID=230148 RepID=A0A4Z2FPV9_9TELE|nr:hypothetical protein EYF80_046526 [Liparis tanakae]